MCHIYLDHFVKVLDLAFADQVFHHPCDVPDRHVRVDTVMVERIDVIGFQSIQRTLDSNPEMLGATVEYLLFIVVAEGEAELGGDHHLIAHRRQGFDHHLLVQVRAVDLGGIKKDQAAIRCRANP